MIVDAEVIRLDRTNLLVKLSGRLTLGMRLRELEAQITDATDENTRRLTLDMSKIDYADSAGLGMVMLLYGRMKTLGGQLRIVAPGEEVQRLFKVTNTDTILTIVPDQAAALAD